LFVVTMSARGQVVIPAELRRRLNLGPGSRFRVCESGSKVILVPELSDPIGAGLGFLRKKASPEAEGRPLEGPPQEHSP